MESIITGIITVEKDGKKNSTLYFTHPFSDYQHQALRCEGSRTDSEWTSLDLSSYKIGDKIELIYGKGFQGKAKLEGIHKISAQSNSLIK